MAMKYLGDSFDLHAGGEDLAFPHHENEIAQSESLTGKPFARFWMHVRFLLVEGEKMSKSAGNFFTLRDLLEKGHKPSSIRFLLASVPYRRQLNFTFDGLKQAANSVERLRNFKSRVEMGQFAPGKNDRIQELAAEAKSGMRGALDDDLNTAQALAAIFDLVRESNTAADRDELRHDDKAPLLEALQQFDEIFAVMNDDDAARLAAFNKSEMLPDSEVDRLVAARTAAKKARDFARADEIRKQLADAGIVVEDTKDGIRWKRK
jgi:cysteinyl-tRNA synthetase